MRKNYETPSVELVKFQYNDQVVAASQCSVTNFYTTEDAYACKDGTPIYSDTYTN